MNLLVLQIDGLTCKNFQKSRRTPRISADGFRLQIEDVLGRELPRHRRPSCRSTERHHQERTHDRDPPALDVHLS